MAAKTRSRPGEPFPDLEPLTDLLRTPPRTTEDRLLHIKALGRRIDGYVRFMCAVNHLNGTCPEAKDKAVELFYERLLALEQALARVHDSLRLG